MFKKNFENLCVKRGESPSAVARKIGISASAYSQWTDDTVPRKATQQKAAEYLGVTVDDLFADPKKVTFISYKQSEITNPTKKELKNHFEKSLFNSDEEPKQQLYTLDQSRVHMVPLFESVSAGFGALAINEVLDYVPLYFTNPIEAAETICIKVHGDSMYPKIEDGDIVQVHKQESVDSGSIAVVLLDGEEGLVKKVVYGETWIELHSINPMYKPMRFNGADVLRIRVVGLVKKIIKDV